MDQIDNKIEIALKWIVAILEKHHIPFQITGGFAAHIYGAQRKIYDIDIDIPENMMESLIPDIKDFIIFGPSQYKDFEWDLKLITLSYQGQEIDLGGAFESQIFDGNKNSWVPCVTSLENSQLHTIYGIKIPVVDPYDFINYKKLRIGKDHEIDVEAVERYLSKHY